jgi:hypothetical protein
MEFRWAHDFGNDCRSSLSWVNDTTGSLRPPFSVFKEEVVNFGGKNLGHQLWRTGGIVRPTNFVPLLDKERDVRDFRSWGR